MSDTLDELNTMRDADARATFLRCCGASVWAGAMTARRPYRSLDQMEAVSESLWSDFTVADWLEAFAHHPKIGDIDSLRTKFATTRAWAGNEQSGTASASEETLQALAAGNAAYEARFGYIFIVCATGKTADEMLTLLNARLHHDPVDELPIAAEEQKKITRLRLRKL